MKHGRCMRPDMPRVSSDDPLTLTCSSPIPISSEQCAHVRIRLLMSFEKRKVPPEPGTF